MGFEFDDQIMQATWAGQPDIERRLQRTLLLAQAATRRGAGHDLQVLLGTQAGPSVGNRRSK